MVVESASWFKLFFGNLVLNGRGRVDLTSLLLHKSITHLISNKFMEQESIIRYKAMYMTFSKKE